MILLTVIADDFTGALDTGVQLAAAGYKTRVLSSAILRRKQRTTRSSMLLRARFWPVYR